MLFNGNQRICAVCKLEQFDSELAFIVSIHAPAGGRDWLAAILVAGIDHLGKEVRLLAIESEMTESVEYS